MSCIRFKFKSSIEYEKLTFDGLQISLGELKEAIMKQKKIGLSNQYTLRVVDAQSKKVYEKDDEMLARNTSVVISRIPLVNAPKIPKTQLKDPSLPQPASSSGGSSSGGIPSTSLPPLTSKLTPEELVKTANLVDANATEEEKVMAMMNQSAVGYDPSQYVNVKYSGRRGGMGGGMSKMKPPPTYICYRCGQTGHFINQCPTNGNPNFDNYRYKRLMGTPSNQLMPASMNMPGAMIDRHGNLVVREVDFQAYIQSKMKGKTGTTSAAIEAPKEMEIPPELICSICKEVVKDAVIIPCCGESFCYDCIQEYLCENEFTCPSCKAPDVSPEKLAPNKALRASAKNFKMKAAEIKSEAEARGFTKQTLPPAVILNSTKQLVNKTLPITSTQPTPITSTQPAPITSSQPPTSSQPSFPSTATTSVASSAVTTATSTTAAATTTSGSLSQESTSSLTSVNPPSSAPSAEPGPSTSNVNGHPVSVPSAPVAVGANTIVRQETRGKPTVGRSLSPALEAMMGGLVAAASGNVSPHRSGLMVNGLPGRSTGSVPVVKTNVVASAMAHLLPPRPLTQSISKNISDNAKLADLLLGPGPPKKSPSPPPLSADEFYRQQKLLKLLTKKTTSRSATPGSYSHSSGSDSSLSRSDSHSRSRSRSQTRSWSYDSRSRSRSPHHGSSKASKHSSHRSTVRKHRSHRRHRHQEKVVEKSRERERTSRRPHRKRARHDESRDKKEEGSKRSSKRHRSRTRSPERKKHKEDLLLARDTIISPDMGTSTPTLSDAECGSKVTHKHKHKKRSKRKHRHREREEEKISEKNDLTSVVAAQVESRMEDTAGETALAAVTEMSPLVEDNVADAAITKSGQKSSSSIEDEKTSKTRSSSDKVNDVPSAAERVNDGEIPSVESTAGKRDASQQKEITKNKEKIKSNLVPYQDSSTTEAEPTEDTTLMSGSDSKTDVPDQSATPLPTEEEEDMEESLLLDVHVDESIDELEEELMGAPVKRREAEQEQSDGEIAMEKEEGEISDSEEDSVPTKPAEPKVPQSTHSPLKQSSRIACDKPLPPQPQEDLRAEIERSRQKHNVQSNLSFLPPAIVKVKAKDKSGAKKRKRKVVTPPTESENDSEDEYSSDEEESSSSSNEDESDEIEHTKRRRVSKSSRAKRSKHKHTSKSKDKEREREREIAKERKREREIAKERKREREIAKEREREREIAKEREREREIAKEREREREIAKERERERAGRSKAKKSSRDKKLPKKPKEKSREKVKRKKVKSSSKSRKTNKQ